MIIYRGLSKAEFAEDAGVSPAKLRRWMQEHQTKLTELGVTSKTKVMPPAAIKFLAETYQVFPRNAQIV